jgi:hypothetical protein
MEMQQRACTDCLALPLRGDDLRPGAIAETLLKGDSPELLAAALSTESEVAADLEACYPRRRQLVSALVACCAVRPDLCRVPTGEMRIIFMGAK